MTAHVECLAWLTATVMIVQGGKLRHSMCRGKKPLLGMSLLATSPALLGEADEKRELELERPGF